MKKFAGIWIPYGEIYKRFFGSRNGRIDKVYGQIQKEERSLKKAQIHIEPLTYCFSVCKVEDYSMVDLSSFADRNLIWDFNHFGGKGNWYLCDINI